jgi:hypothetical protein
MIRPKWMTVVALAMCAGWVSAQGLDDVQIHGFATQAFLAGNNNNYLGMETRTGALSWTEAAVNISDQVKSNFRVGIQLHYTRLGIFGEDYPTVDWALGDFKVKDEFAIRAGRVKIRWGLFNDTQDYDPGYLWALLPESTYGVDIRATNLALNGVEFRGRFTAGPKMGKLTYNLGLGYYTYAANDGYMEGFRQMGYTFTGQPAGKTPTIDMRWETPVPGLMFGGSVMAYDASGTMTDGTYTLPTAYWVTGYGQYNHGKWYGAAQYARLVQYQIFTVTGLPPSIQGMDNRSFFAMLAYRFTGKFQAGAYYDQVTNPPGGDTSLPENYERSVVVSGRYDFNSNFYAKLEGNFISGNYAGFYAVDNPNGLRKTTALGVAKIGFTF